MSPRKAHAYQSLSLKKRVWLTVGAVVVSGAGVAAVAMANPEQGPAVHVRPASAVTKSLTALGAGRVGASATLSHTFQLVSLSWNDKKGSRLDGSAQVRTRDAASGKWSGWTTLGRAEISNDASAPHGEPLRALTDLWLPSPADAAQARLVAKDGMSSQLPKGAKLGLIDPGTGAAKQSGGASLAAAPAAYAQDAMDSATPAASSSPTDPSTASASPSTSTTSSPSSSASPSPSSTWPSDCDVSNTTHGPAPSSPVVAPPITTRAQWGADENLECPARYAPDGIKGVIIHHTGETNANSYSCADSDARVRAIQQEEMTQNGWNDIGYNFLVDKCGRIFEGRGGGVDQPVIGAHDYGFNTGYVGIAWIGNSDDAHPTRAALNAIARIAAWKLGMYGIDPESSATFTSGSSNTGSGMTDTKYNKGQSATLPVIFGHRDTYVTDCPGTHLYSDLPLVRKLAGAPGISHALATSDYNHDGANDMILGLRKAQSGAGAIVAVPGSDKGPVTAAKRIITQNSTGVPGASEAGDGFGTDTAMGDVNGDGIADVVIGSPGEDDTIGHRDNGAVTVLYGPKLTSGTLFSTPSATRTSNERLGQAVASGDFNGDGKADVLAVASGAPGRWWQWDGATHRLTSGYLGSSAYTSAVSYAHAATGDFNRDGYADVAINYRDPSGHGRVVVLDGSASGLKRYGTLTVAGGRSIAAGDINGDSYDDIVIGQPYSSESDTHVGGGAVTAVYGSSNGLTSTGTKMIYQGTSGVPGAAEAGDGMGMSVAVGDYNLDGYADVLVGVPYEDLTSNGVSVTNAGNVILLNGSSSGLTGSGARSYSQNSSGVPGVSEKYDHMGSAVTLADFSGQAYADLAIGVSGENSGDGMVNYFPSGSSGILSASSPTLTRGSLGTPAGANLGGQIAP